MATLREKIAVIDKKVFELQRKRAELEAAAANEVNPEHIVAGAVVDFTYGKGEGKKTLRGTVVGVKAAEKGADLVRITVGEGFDAQTVTSFTASVTKVVSSPAAPAPAEQSAE